MTSTPLRDVIIVSAHSETLDGLQAYLSHAGLSAKGRSSLQAVVASPPGTVVILFPDDFEREDVQRSLDLLLRAKIRTLVVTADPKRFRAALNAEHGGSPVIIPKPAWGWNILDTIHQRNEI